jgi:hypothetical protein
MKVRERGEGDNGREGRANKSRRRLDSDMEK